MKYILDFDRTLFNTDALYEQFKTDSVDQAVLVPELLKHYPTQNFLYQDVLPFLHSRRPTDITILTALGTEKYGPHIKQFQQAKIEQEPIVSLVQAVVYVDREKGGPAADIARQFPPHEPIVFVDDLLVNCLAVKAVLPGSHCFLLRRHSTATSIELGDLPITPVHTLKEVDDKMNTL